MHKKKVLHIIKSLGRGGAEVLLQETLKHHNQEEYEFYFIYFLPWKNQMVEGIEKAGGKVNLFPAKNNIQILFQIFNVIRFIKKNKIDLIHCHLPWAGFLGRFIYKLVDMPVFYTEHNKQERYHFITKTLNKFTFNWQSKVIAVSDDVSHSIRSAINPKIEVVTIVNGVNTNFYKRDEADGLQKRQEFLIEESTILIGTIAVFRFQKRLKEWVELFKMTHEKHPNIRGCIIGDGILREEILNHVKALGIEDYIIFPGLQTNVKSWLSAIDIFMMTSSFEGLPIALLEAMSMECAIVATNAGGIKEVIRNEKDGFIVSVDQWDLLQNPLYYLIQNSNEIKIFGNKARSRVIESFSIETMVNKIELLYNKELRNK
jgi:glycosyltransferase involved in cell wall biosynthesis